MEELRKLAEAAQNHFEKLILLLALVGLGLTVFLLSMVLKGESDKLADYAKGARKLDKPLPPVPMVRHEAALKTAEHVSALDLGLPHHLFNPVKWQLQADGTMLKIKTGQEVGPAVMVITNLTELNYILALERVTSAGGYFFSVTREAAEHPLARLKVPKFATLNSSNEFFMLREIKGPPDAPTEFILELTDTQERVAVAPDKPYTRVDGYEVSLKYPVEGKVFANQRLGAVLRFAGEDYKIVDIRPDEVVLSASSNDRKYPVRRFDPPR